MRTLWLAVVLLLVALLHLSAAASASNDQSGGWLSTLKSTFNKLVSSSKQASSHDSDHTTKELDASTSVPSANGDGTLDEVPIAPLSEEEIEAKLVNAATFYEEKKFPEAVDQLVDIISANPDNVLAQSALGGMLLALRQFELAQTILYSAVRVSQWRDVPSVINLAGVLQELNDTQLAVKTLMKGYQVEKQSKGDVLPYLSALGDLHKDMQDFSSAADWYLSAATTAPRCDVDLWLQASTLRFSGSARRVDEAVRVLSLAVSKCPDNTELLYWLGRVLIEDSQIEQSIVMLEEVLRLDQTHDNALMALATAHHSLRHTDSALHYYNLALQRMPKNLQLLQNAARLLHLLQRDAEAVKLLNSAMQLAPSDAAVRSTARELGFTVQ